MTIPKGSRRWRCEECGSHGYAVYVCEVCGRPMKDGVDCDCARCTDWFLDGVKRFAEWWAQDRVIIGHDLLEAMKAGLAAAPSELDLSATPITEAIVFYDEPFPAAESPECGHVLLPITNRVYDDDRARRDAWNAMLRGFDETDTPDYFPPEAEAFAARDFERINRWSDDPEVIVADLERRAAVETVWVETLTPVSRARALDLQDLDEDAVLRRLEGITR